KGKARQEQLALWLQLPEPQVLFEAPHRILALLEDLETAGLGNRPVCFGRELTKQFETFYRGKFTEVVQHIRTDPYAEKGEWVLLWAGATAPGTPSAHEIHTTLEQAAQELLQHLPARTATDLLVTLSGLPKKQVYQAVLDIKNSMPPTAPA
ncbi:MAG: hypothetical protein HC848_08705, partial [Limnobacter sp.]|nr:hypothetical protein [Limnobacter sp.]